MTKYREILRLTALGLSLRDIEKSLKVSRKTVVKVQKRADELSLSWPLDESLTDAELEQRMFPKDLSPKSTKRMPDFDYIRKELLKNGVNKKLLWTEYLEECSQNGDDALMYSQFCYYIQQNDTIYVTPAERKINTRSDTVQYIGWTASGLGLIIGIVALCAL